MTPKYYIVLAVLSLSLHSLCLATLTVDPECRKKLLTNDPHLDSYIGQVFTLEGKHDKNKNGEPEEKYTYELGVCTNAHDNDKECGVIQSNITNPSPSNTRCTGKLNNAQVSRTRDGVWIELTYPDGDPYNNHCNGSPRVTRLIFLCDPLVQGLGQFEFLEESRDENVCFYTFTVAAKAVCGSLLSWGDIIMIIFAVALFLCVLAMLGGFLFKRFIQGAKGWEQIPLLSWFREFGNLQADGCDLVCRSRKIFIKEYREPTFGADTDDEDDDKDDNLLPM